MVVIDQLPLLVSSCEDGCLLPDNIICQPSPIATQDSVRCVILVLFFISFSGVDTVQLAGYNYQGIILGFILTIFYVYIIHLCRLSVHLTSRAFWDHLCEHFVCLLRHNAMNPGKIAEIFAPLLISDDSPYSNGVCVYEIICIHYINNGMLCICVTFSELVFRLFC